MSGMDNIPSSKETIAAMHLRCSQAWEQAVSEYRARPRSSAGRDWLVKVTAALTVINGAYVRFNSGFMAPEVLAEFYDAALSAWIPVRDDLAELNKHRAFAAMAKEY